MILIKSFVIIMKLLPMHIIIVIITWIGIGTVLIAVEGRKDAFASNWRQSVHFQMLVEQLPPTDVVRTLGTLVRRSSRAMKLLVVDELTLAVDDVRTRTACVAFGARIPIHLRIFQLCQSATTTQSWRNLINWPMNALMLITWSVGAVRLPAESIFMSCIPCRRRCCISSLFKKKN